MHAYIHPHGYQNRSTEGSLVCRGREGSVSVSCAVRHRREASVSLSSPLTAQVLCQSVSTGPSRASHVEGGACRYLELPS